MVFISYAKKILCLKCGKEYKPDMMAFKCKCGGILDIIYDYKRIRKRIIIEDFIRENPWQWKYWMFYPVDDLTKLVSFEEGGTSLFLSKEIGNKIGCGIYFKYEGTNPTGSFKDRGSSVEITKAVELGINSVASVSTGNMGASLSPYCRKVGIEFRAFIPEKTQITKIFQMKTCGADIIKVKGTHADCLKLTEEANRKYGVYLMGDYPYRVEGQKSIGFEIIDQLYWNVPDYVICPMGNGNLITALWKSFIELKKTGFIDKLPKIVGVQAEGCKPIVDALKNNLEKPIPIKEAKTIVDSIACENPMNGTEAVAAIRESDGFAVAVTDEEILNAQKILGKSEGLFAEPSGAVSTAGLLKYRNNFKGKKVVCIVTGHGLKHLPGKLQDVKTIEKDISELDKIYS